MSDFGPLQLALSALYAQRRGLDTTGHNIANVNTEGYSRQRVETVANSGPKVPARFAIWEGGGAGVSVEDITRTRETFLEIRSYLEHGADASLQQTKSALASIEKLFNEPSDNGVQKQLADFWAGWDDVANRPGDLAARNQLLQRAGTVAATFNKASSDFDTMRAQALDVLGADVAEINTLASSIAILNSTIQTAHVARLPHNDLLDQRDLLLSKLSDKIGITTRQGDNETIDVLVNGSALVANDRTNDLAVDASGSSVAIDWLKDGYVANSSTGDVGGLLTVVNDIIARYRTGLDTIAASVADTVNSAHAALTGTFAAGEQDLSGAGALQFGLTVNGTAYPDVSVVGADWSGVGGAAALQSALQAALDTATGAAGVVTAAVTGGNGTPLSITLAGATPTVAVRVATVAGNTGLSTLLSTTAVGLDGIGGRPFFTGTTARALAVDTAVANNPGAIGAALANGGTNDGHVAVAISGLSASSTGADQLYRAYIVGLGVETQNTNRRAMIQSDVARQVDSSRESQAGVNIDEEMINMTSYQHAYSAAARYMTAIDEMLDHLVNHTGLVGR